MTTKDVSQYKLEGNGFFTRENADMAEIRKAYQSTSGLNKDGYYMFLLGSADASSEDNETQAHGAQGDMPRGQRFGYVFSERANDIGWLLAHELGHGMFTLKHLNDANYAGKSSLGSIKNLMDYTGSVMLGAFQWNVMSNPAVITAFDGDDASKYGSFPYLKLIKQAIQQFEKNNPCVQLVSIEQYTKNSLNICKIEKFSFSVIPNLNHKNNTDNKLIIKYIVRSTNEVREIMTNDISIDNTSINKKLGVGDNSTIEFINTFWQQILYIAKETILADLSKLPNVDDNKCMQQRDASKALVVFIGGANDKSQFTGMEFLEGKHTEIIKKLKAKFDIQFKNTDGYKSLYLGYEEVYGDYNIEQNVLSQISNSNTKIFIVGHSLGGWNGAHLSQILVDRGHPVQVLITLDPVGTRGQITNIDIYLFEPKPKCDYWINIYSNPDNSTIDDNVADAGGRWKPSSTTPNILHTSTKHHGDAQGMFDEILQNNKSINNILTDNILNFLNDNTP